MAAYRSSSNSSNKGQLRAGTKVAGTWTVGERIGQGTFSQVFLAYNRDTDEVVAIKVEKPSPKPQLNAEQAVLSSLQPYPFFPRLLHFCYIPQRESSSSSSGSSSSKAENALVMQMLGQSITQVRLRQPSGRFRPSTALDLSLQMLHSIEACHRAGWVHRDIKPSNFCVGAPAASHRSLPHLGELSGVQRYARASAPPTMRDLNLDTCRELRGQVFLLDYGLARCYLTTEGKAEAASRLSADCLAALPDGAEGAHRPQTKTGIFRGTKSYASTSAHELKDLGRRDDLWSLFYTIVDLVTPGGLPWRDAKRERDWRTKRRKAAAALNALARESVEMQEAEAAAEAEAAGSVPTTAPGPAASSGADWVDTDEDSSPGPDAASAGQAGTGLSRDEVHKMKESFMADPVPFFPPALPGCAHLVAFAEHLAGLGHHSKPDYLRLAGLLVAAREDLAAAEAREEDDLWARWLVACGGAGAGEQQGAGLPPPPPPPSSAAAAVAAAAASPASGDAPALATRRAFRSFPGGTGPDGSGKPPSNRIPPAALRDAVLAVAPALDCEDGIFDLRGVPMSCDAVLESRGGAWTSANDPAMSLALVGVQGRSQRLLDMATADDEGQPAVMLPRPGCPWGEMDMETALYHSLGRGRADALVTDQTEAEAEEARAADTADAADDTTPRRPGKRARPASSPSSSSPSAKTARRHAATLPAGPPLAVAHAVATFAVASAQRADALGAAEAAVALARQVRARLWPLVEPDLGTMDPSHTQAALAVLAACADAAAKADAVDTPPGPELCSAVFALSAEHAAMEVWVSRCARRPPPLDDDALAGLDEAPAAAGPDDGTAEADGGADGGQVLAADGSGRS